MDSLKFMNWPWWESKQNNLNHDYNILALIIPTKVHMLVSHNMQHTSMDYVQLTKSSLIKSILELTIDIKGLKTDKKKRDAYISNTPSVPKKKVYFFLK